MTETITEHSYVGWVPCLSGQLVFELVECGLKNGSSINIVHHANNKDEKLTEYILLHSTVNWKDFGDKNYLKGVWSVVLLSKRTVDDNQHQGSVFFVLDDNKYEKKSWIKATGKLKELNYQLNTKQDTDVPSEFIAIETGIKNSGCLSANFKLEHDGIVWLKPSPSHHDSIIIARQAYYYIKYAWHKHQHHDNRAETLTTAHKAEVESLNNSIANSLINDLKINLVRFKREICLTSHSDLLKAKGIISYAKALVEILKNRQVIDNDFYNREINHLHYFQESLDVSYASIDKDMLLHSQAVNDARAIILFIFSIITPALIINKDADPVPDYIQWISNWYQSNISFSLVVAGIALFLWVFVSINSHYGNFWVSLFGFKKAVARVVNDNENNSIFSNANVLSITSILLGLCLLILGIYGLGSVIGRQ